MRTFFIILLSLYSLCLSCNSQDSYSPPVYTVPASDTSRLEEEDFDVKWAENEWVDTPVYLNTGPLYPASQYPVYRTFLQDSLAKLREMYQQAGEFKADSLREIAGNLLAFTLTQRYFPCWYGTEWDFNGYTARPQQGKIACGYFVSTPLLHAGFRLNRYRLAQQGAAEIIESLSGEDVEIYRNLLFPDLIQKLKALPAGLYVVGLYNHVGWIQVTPEEVYFIHSTFIGPGKVIREIAEKSEVLEWSDIYVVGSISENKKLMDSWLRNDTLEVVMTR